MGKVTAEGHARYVEDGLSDSLVQALRGRSAVGADKAADAKFDAAEPTRNHHDRTVETLPVDGGQDGFAGTRPEGGMLLEDGLQVCHIWL